MYRFYLVNFSLQFIEREQLNWFYRADFRIKVCHDLKLRYAQTFWEKNYLFQFGQNYNFKNNFIDTKRATKLVVQLSSQIDEPVS